jgi:hypothetical protein
METNNITSIIPGVNLLPPRWQGYAVIILAAAPYITRAWHSLSGDGFVAAIQKLGSMGGVKGILSAIFLGTNTPKAPISGTEVPVRMVSSAQLDIHDKMGQ